MKPASVINGLLSGFVQYHNRPRLSDLQKQTLDELCDFRHALMFTPEVISDKDSKYYWYANGDMNHMLHEVGLDIITYSFDIDDINQRVINGYIQAINTYLRHIDADYYTNYSVTKYLPL